MTSKELDEKTIFNVARKITSPTERAEYLHEACKADRDLLKRAIALLEAYEDHASFLEPPPADYVPAIAQTPAEQVGSLIGPYKLIEEIGEGGMGNVYMALQKTPVRRKVALKVIKPGMDSKQVVSRFEAERQALALMDHPSIARVFDGGSTESGRPYFVMELVQGLPLTKYCDRYRLSLRERLELFVQVCQAVQHAHQKGVIHRDLKPPNIMVTLYDGQPVPKVIDFGVAKATSGQLSEATLVTNYTQMLGTPLYMSPEQTALSSQGVDTRSDVYSLGVILYELLTGTTPFERKDVDDVSFEELRRIIRENEPPKPSTRLSTLDTSLDTIDEEQLIGRQVLSHQVKGELDWIVMKALEKDRERRYESAGDLARDVGRYLNDEPVDACPPSKTYLLRRTVRRHKTFLLFMAAVILSLILGLVGTTWQAMVATDAKDLARQRLDETNRQREIAEQRKESLRQSLYAADIGTAYEVWLTGNQQWAVAKLEELRPHENESDLRGFEWHYLWRLCHSGRQMLPKHGGDVYGVAFSSDGKLLATASQDKTANVWDITTDRLVTALDEHAGELNCVAFSPDGRWLAIGADNRTILIRDTESWELKAVLTGHNDNVLCVAFSPDGRLLASGAWDDRVRLWDAIDFKAIVTFEGHANDVEYVAFSPDSKTLAAACWSDNSVRLWDTASGEERMVLNGHAQRVFCLAFSHDGRLIASGDKDYTVRLWDAATGEMLHTLTGHTEWVRGVAFSPDDRILASCSNDAFIRFWDTATGELIKKVRGNSDRLRAIAYSSDGKTLATAGSRGIVRLWKADEEQERRALVKSTTQTTSTSFGYDGRLLTAVSEPAKTRFTLWDPALKTELATFGQNTNKVVWAAALAPDGHTFATGLHDGTVNLCDLATGEVRVSLGKHADEVRRLEFLPDGQTLIAASWDNIVKLWDVAGKREPLTLTVGECAVALDPSGEILATPGEDGSVDLWNPANGRLRKSLRGHEDTVGALAFSPDGTILASGAGDHTIRFWDVATGQQRGVLLGHADSIIALTISPDGKTLASASADDVIRLWNVTSRRELFMLKQGIYTYDIRFSPDAASLIANGAANATPGIYLWSASRPCRTNRPLDQKVPGAALGEARGVP